MGHGGKMGNTTGLAALNLLTVREIRDIFGVSRSTVYRWIDQGKFSKVGKVNGQDDYQRQKVLLLEPLDETLIEEIQAWIRKRARSKKPLFLAQKLARNAIDQIPIEPIDQDQHDEKKLSKEIQALLAELSEEREARNRFLQELEMAARDLKTDAGLSEEAQLTKILTSLDKIRQSELELLQVAEDEGNAKIEEEKHPHQEAASVLESEPLESEESLPPDHKLPTPDQKPELKDEAKGESLEPKKESKPSLEENEEEITEEDTQDSLQAHPSSGLPSNEGILENAEGDDDLLTIELTSDDLPAWLDAPGETGQSDQGISLEEEEDLGDPFLDGENDLGDYDPEEEEVAEAQEEPKDPDCDELEECSLQKDEILEGLEASFLGQEGQRKEEPSEEELPAPPTTGSTPDKTSDRAEESARSLAMLFGIAPEGVAPPAQEGDSQETEPQEKPSVQEHTAPEETEEMFGLGDEQAETKASDEFELENEQEPQASLQTSPDSSPHTLAAIFGLDPATGKPLEGTNKSPEEPEKEKPIEEPGNQEEGKRIAMVFDAPPSMEKEDPKQEEGQQEEEEKDNNTVAMVFEAPPNPSSAETKGEPKDPNPGQSEESSDNSVAMVFGAPPAKEAEAESSTAQDDSVALVFDTPPSPDQEEKNEEQSEEASDNSVAMVFGAPPAKEPETESSTARDDSVALVFDTPPSPDQEEKNHEQSEESSDDSVAMVFGAPPAKEAEIQQEEPQPSESLQEKGPRETPATPAGGAPTQEPLKAPSGLPQGEKGAAMVTGLEEIRGPVTEIAQHTRAVAESLDLLTETAQGAAQEFRKKLEADNSQGKTLVTLGLFTLGVCWFLAMTLKPFLGGAGFYVLLAANLAASITVLLGRKKIIESASTQEE